MKVKMKSNGTEEFILLDQIIVTEEFLNSHPSVEKTQQVINHVKRTGYLDIFELIKGVSSGFWQFTTLR
jgi:hypothetical protein